MPAQARDETLPDEPRGPCDSDVVRPHDDASGRVVYSRNSRVPEGGSAIEERSMGEPDERCTDGAPEPFPEGARQPGDDFFCVRYRVWYPSFDCAIRTRFRTSEGCLRCDQGRFNLKRHATALRGVRFRLAAGE
jgi:hypothetical protein